MLHEHVINYIKYYENDVINSITATYNLNYNKLNDLLIIIASQKRFKKRSNFIFSSLINSSYSLMYFMNKFFNFIKNLTL